MSAPLDAHEERDLEMVLRIGAGQRQEDPRAAAEWLTDWLNNGLLALNAFQGYFHVPRMGTENIKRLLFAPERSQVEGGARTNIVGCCKKETAEQGQT